MALHWPLSPEMYALFWSQVRRTETCWEWTGPMNSQWYGMFKGELAHRVSFRLAFGPIPPKLMICHHCDHPPCIRPSRLFLGTMRENALDMVAKGIHPKQVRRSYVVMQRLLHQMNLKGWREGRISIERRVLIKETGLDHYTIHGLLSGHMTEYPPHVLEVLCAYFECTPADLLGTAPDDTDQ